MDGDTGVFGRGYRPTYRTPDEWKKLNELPKYGENRIVRAGFYDERIVAECENGVFACRISDDVKSWKGIPYAEIPGRFERSVPPKKSQFIKEAYHHGKSCLQPVNACDPSSMYEQGESDMLTLSVYTYCNDMKDKPVLVFIHGGWMLYGGTALPTYDGSNFVRCNRDMIVVVITYRLGLLGQINLRMLSDYDADRKKYETATNNGTLDQIQALRWIKRNISAFGGDPDNITISGESAGAWAASNLTMMACDPTNPWISADEKLFTKVMCTSGGVNQCVSLGESERLTKALMKDFGADTIEKLCAIPYKSLADWWRKIPNYICNNMGIMDGNIIPVDPVGTYKRCVKNQIISLHGVMSDEFGFYEYLLKNEMDYANVNFDEMCRAVAEMCTGTSENDFVISGKFRDAYGRYRRALEKEGYRTDEEINRQIANDVIAQGINYYMAKTQSDNGGESYIFVFDQGYDGQWKHVGAGHAVDCYYLFGNFNGDVCLGNRKEVKFSVRYQRAVANFCRTGNPSTDAIKFWKYESEHRFCTLISASRIKMFKKYHLNRMEAVADMIDSNMRFRYSPSMYRMLEAAKAVKK